MAGKYFRNKWLADLSARSPGAAESAANRIELNLRTRGGYLVNEQTVEILAE